MGGVQVQLHSLTLALDQGELSSSHLRHFTSGKRSLVPTSKEAGCATQPVWPLQRKQKSLSLPRSELQFPSHPGHPQGKKNPTVVA